MSSKTISYNYAVEKKVLSNGLTILIHKTDMLPQIDIQLWYHVGSKDEAPAQRGMAHLIEHMLFKGTQNLSEGDYDLVTQKIAGYANAFTSYDYTAYVFQVPSNAYQEPLFILADTMQNAHFDKQMLASEMMAVIQELKMYKDDYESELVEKMLGVFFPEHPYHNPVVGYKHDLAHMTQENLLQFYRQHYQPQNAALVAVGDVDVAKFIAEAEQQFGGLKNYGQYTKDKLFFEPSLCSKSVTIYRDITYSWCSYAFEVPGQNSNKSHLYDMITSLLGKGKCSRLYALLVQEKEIATDVECFSFNLFTKAVIFIGVRPKRTQDIGEIERLIYEQIDLLTTGSIEEWELERIKKRLRLGFADLMQCPDKQAVFIGHSFLALGSSDHMMKYLEDIENTTTADLERECAAYLRATVMYSGYLLPAPESEKKFLAQLQVDADKLETDILSGFNRTAPVEGGRYVKTLKMKQPMAFETPKPEEFTLSNGLVVLYYHTPSIPHISVLLNPQVDHLYDPEKHAGINSFLYNLLDEGTKDYSAIEWSKRLEMEGIDLDIKPGLITLQMLTQGLKRSLELLTELVTDAHFEPTAVERVRNQLLADLEEYWESPSDFVDQIARQTIYKDHPYSKNSYGSPEGISAIQCDDLRAYHKQYMSPKGACIALVGDLEGYTKQSLTTLLEQTIGKWSGPEIPVLKASPIEYQPGQKIKYEIHRDQVVLGFIAPSIARTSMEYDILSLLDVVLIGGQLGSMSSRLFQLREQSGLFYTIGGSLVYGAHAQPGMVFIKTLVSLDKVEQAEQAIKAEIERMGCQGIIQEEFEMARNVLMRSEVKHFESTTRIAQTLLLLKRCELGFDYFDKRAEKLAKLDLSTVNKVASSFCKQEVLSVIKIGRV